MLFCQNGAKGIANSEELDQTAPLGAVWSGSVLFAKTYLSENLWSLLYLVQYLLFFNLKFQASDHLLWKYSLIYVWPGQKPRRQVSHDATHMFSVLGVTLKVHVQSNLS